MNYESGMILTSLKMLFALGAVLAILLFIYYFIKKIMNKGKFHYKEKLQHLEQVDRQHHG